MGFTGSLSTATTRRSRCAALRPIPALPPSIVVARSYHGVSIPQLGDGGEGRGGLLSFSSATSFHPVGNESHSGPYPTEASREARQLARVAESLAGKSEAAGHFKVAAKWLAVATFLRDIAEGAVTVVTQGRIDLEGYAGSDGTTARGS